MSIPGAAVQSNQQVGSFHVALATSTRQIEASQRLRYEIFCHEVGA
jgi:putative hemolysin